MHRRKKEKRNRNPEKVEKSDDTLIDASAVTNDAKADERDFRQKVIDGFRYLVGVKIEEKVGPNKDEEPRFTTLEHGNHVKKRNYDGTITNNFKYSENMNRFLAPERPYGNKPELWTGHDVWTYHRKNNHLIHTVGISMAGVTALLAYAIEYYLSLQTDFYTRWGRFTTFQHIPELKYMYIGIRENSSDMGYNPGWWPAYMMIATDIVGIIEVILAKRGYSWFTLNRILWTMAFMTIVLGIPVYINNFAAVFHQGWVVYGWGFGSLSINDTWIQMTGGDWGGTRLRNRSGYCHMVEQPYLGRISPKYVTPPEIRACRDMTCYHIIQMMYCSYTGIVAYTILKMVRVPAWGDWNKEKLIAHGKGLWNYTGP